MKTRRKLYSTLKILSAISAIISIFANWNKAYPTIKKLFLPIGNFELFKPLLHYSYFFKITSIVFSIIAILFIFNFFIKFLKVDNSSNWKLFALSTIALISIILNDAINQKTLIIGLIIYMLVLIFITIVGITFTRISYYTNK